MYRQRGEVRGGSVAYSTELAGRDRFKFFRRPVEPSGGELHAGDLSDVTGGSAGATANDRSQNSGTWTSAQVHYAASTPAAPALNSRGAGAGDGVLFNPKSSSARQRRPSSVDLSPGARRGRGSGRQPRQGKSKRARMHHLPTMGSGTNYASTMPSGSSSSPVDAEGGYYDETGAIHRRDCGMQTVYRENEAQTDPYSPDYFIPDGAPEPEILKLQGLTYQNGGLPAGREEVELIQRLRRRREVEAALPQGNDDASIEERFRQLHALEEEEWRDREAHVEHLQARRLDRMKETLMEREAAREEANKDRLERIKAQYMSTLSGKLNTLQGKSMGDRRRAMDRKIARNRAGGVEDSSEGAPVASGTTGGASGRQAGGANAKPDLIQSYVQYGARAAPPTFASETTPSTLAAGGASAGGGGITNTTAMTYDVRPVLLTVVEGVEEVDHRRGGRIEHVAQSTFAVPENEAIARLPTLYQRREAERLVQSLERAHNQIVAAKTATSKATTAAEGTVGLANGTSTTATGDGGTLMQAVAAEIESARAPRSVLDLYRAPPKVQRPPTPELELDGDAEEDSEEACILLQRLLRGRAVQNDFFEGKERCRGLIQELQAASDAKEAEEAMASAKKDEALVQQQAEMVDIVVSAAVGDIIGDTLGYLYQELDRQRDVQSLEALRTEAEAVRKAREATELARREAERLQRDKEALQYAAVVRATSGNVTAFLEAARARAVQATALAVAVEAERTRQSQLPGPRDPTVEVDKENLVCDMLDGFVVPAIVDSLLLLDRERQKEAPAGAARDIARDIAHGAAAATVAGGGGDDANDEEANGAVDGEGE